MTARALRLYAGPKALQLLQREGLQPHHVGVIPAAAGGPKGLVLGPLDRFLFGQWLPASQQPIALVGGSIGAWRMATACLSDPVSAFERLERDYIAQDFAAPAGRHRPSADQVSAQFSESLKSFYGGRVHEVLTHPRYQLHLLTSRGRHVLARDQAWRTAAGYAGAYLSNMVSRKAMGWWLERVVFSSRMADLPLLPFHTTDYATTQVGLSSDNFMAALQASCSIPFAMRAVPEIAGAPAGAYWDGGICDYHLHLNYNRQPGLVLYPHFQKAVVPGWLDKALQWRHAATPFLDKTLVLAPDPDWVRQLPNGKLPDRRDFTHYSGDVPARMQAWNTAVSASQQLADELADWLQAPDLSRVEPL